ncbi:MAG: hypothetical protein R2770_03730 [Acidimicrobiales bacterium]
MTTEALDLYDSPVAGTSASVAAWNRAWQAFGEFKGDPFAELADANASDDGFAMGSVFEVVYTVLAGSRLDAPSLLASLERARARATNRREQLHLQAAELLVVGEFTTAAEAWDSIAAASHDFAAVRYAHDIYLHVGDNERRLRSSTAAIDGWQPDQAGYGLLLGQYSFALCEAAHYDEAESTGRLALQIEPRDLWARHGLAHVYEMRDQTAEVLALLDGADSVWHDQDMLSTHVWWHLAVRLIVAGDHERALQIHDDLVPVATTAFRLCDLSSLLWRLELAGVDVGERWVLLADRWSEVAEIHTCGFLDLHAALAFGRVSDHPGAHRFRDGLAQSHPEPRNEIGRTFSEVVKPMVAAIEAYCVGDFAGAANGLATIESRSHRIGGSNAQRDLLNLTHRSASAQTN